MQKNGEVARRVFQERGEDIGDVAEDGLLLEAGVFESNTRIVPKRSEILEKPR